MAANPYTPGAGFMPAYLAGREELVKNATGYLESIKGRYPQQSVIYYGLRGVGKTVLLNKIEEIADDLDILYVHIEANESKLAVNFDSKFTAKLINALYKFNLKVSRVEKAKDFAQKCGNLLRSFAITYNVADESFKLGVEQDAPIISGGYADDLTEIMVQLGKAANRSNDTICIFVDEVQYLSLEELGGLISAIHRCNQLRLPIMLFCAGLPKILKTAGEAFSYSERLFKFEKIDALSGEEAEAAIQEPAKDFDVVYEDCAIQRIIEITGGYPYFIQQFCSVIWSKKTSETTINLETVNESVDDFFADLDSGFFAVRYERCTPQEKIFMIAMVKCGELPCTISNVAQIMHRAPKSISPLRGQLISKGMIYPVAHGQIDFTVPQFDNFIKRINPEMTL